MKILRALILICCIFSFEDLLAQVRQIVLPQEYDGLVDSKELEFTQEFFTLPYTGPTVNLVSMVERYPASNIPYIVEITAPDLSNYIEPVIMAMHLKGDLLEEGSLALVISAKNKEQPDVFTFFVDKNMDFDFLNDSKPIEVRMGSKSKKVILTPEYGVEKKIFLSVDNPMIDEKTQNLIDRNEKKKIRNQFALGMKAGFGVGKLKYNFDNLETGFPTWYSVNYIEKNIGLSVSYNLPNLIFGASATYQNLYFYTSYLNIRTDVDRVVYDSFTGRSRIFPKVNVLRNNDIHDRNQLQFAGSFSYRISMGKSAEFQPTISGGHTSYFAKEYIGDRRGDQEKFPLKGTAFIEAGMNIEFTIGRFRSFYFGGMYNQLFWKPEGYFESTEHENLDSTGFRTFVISLGYRMAIDK